MNGYYGDGFKCLDINECIDSFILCGEYVLCYNIFGFYKCVCNLGWIGDG